MSQPYFELNIPTVSLAGKKQIFSSNVKNIRIWKRYVGVLQSREYIRKRRPNGFQSNELKLY